MKLNYIGQVNNNPTEWFWTFNAKFLKLLESRGHSLSSAKRLDSRNASGWVHHEVFGYKTCLNANNLLLINPKTEKVVLFTTFFDLRQLCGGACNLPLDNMSAIYSGHFDEKIISRDAGLFQNLIKPWYFRPWNREDLYPENVYQPENNNLFFRGINISGIRTAAAELQKLNIEGIDVLFSKTNNKDYCKAMQSAGVCFSLSGIRDMCNRDIEYWRAGVPFIRPRFTSKLIVDIPDDAYFPIEWESDYTSCTPRPANPKKLALDIVERYKEIRNNQKLLNEVGKNGHSFYKKHFTTENILNKSFELLERSGFLTNE